MIFDDDEDIKWWEVIWYKVKRVTAIPREIKWFLQKIIRPYHASDKELWSLDYHLAKIILPKLKAFRKMDQVGYPMQYCEWSKDLGLTQEDYDRAVERGDMSGGEEERWLKDIDEMIFALDYIVNYEGYDKKRNKFLKKWDLEDPFLKVEKNKKETFIYAEDGGEFYMHSDSGEEKEGWKLVNKRTYYYNPNLAREYAERAQEGTELFGKMFRNLCD